MPLSINHNLQTNSVSGVMADVATAGSILVPVPFKGSVIGGGCGISAALTGTDTVITVSKINPQGVTTIGTITIPAAGSGAGSQYGLVITGNAAACHVEAFESLQFASDGAGTGPAVANFAALIRGG